MARSYLHLSFQERIKIAKWREAKMSVPEMADRLGRAPSTIYREIKRNSFTDQEPSYLNGDYGMARSVKRPGIVREDAGSSV
ncbi:IS30 family transposase [Sagittula marina]|uniref:IS30 family transposase n=1 Tax=Sagittula marina TaxID=943940 RepID=A0A7W6GTA4_9RHOB|nr:IS30 family transposase [Sagittula marina]